MRILGRGRPLPAVVAAIARMRADPAAPLPVGVAAEELPAPVLAELAALRRDLRLAQLNAARLAGLITAVGRFSHDLRGTISPALLLAERLQANKDPAVSRAGDMLVRTVERASEMLREMVSTVRAGGVPISPSLFPLRAVIAEAVDEAMAGTAPLAVAVTGPDAVDIEADRAALRAVFVALLRNAAQAGAGSVRIAVSDGPGEVMMDIADDGPGLPPLVTQHLFEPLVPTPAKPEGGLGLALIRHLLHANSGTIGLRETGAAGTCFIVTLSQKGRARVAA